MPAIAPFEIGLCSWSFHLNWEPQLRAAMEKLGLRVLHLALGPIASLPAAEQARVVGEFRNSPLAISAGMVSFSGEDYSNLRTIRETGGLVPDATAEARLAHAVSCGKVAKQLGLTQVSTHAGFVPHASDAAAFDKLVTRIRRLADAFAGLGLDLLFETGQETADDLLTLLAALQRPNVGVNFDPANMILYGKGDPVSSVRKLAGYVRHVHAKDAKAHVPPPADPQAWRGNEVPLGQGDAKLPEVIRALRESGYNGPLVIEREAGEDRQADVRSGIDFLRRACGA